MSFTIPTPFQASLLPASYNGIPFFVTDTGIKSGQRVAIHEFPFRSIPYAEDLGKATRMFNFTAFIVGDAPFLQAQYGALLTAIETPGSGRLVHPVFGEQTVICVAAEFEQNTAGRYVEIRFQFVEAGEIIFPTTGADTQADTIQIADQAQQTNVSQFDSYTDSTSTGVTGINNTPAPTEGVPGAEALNPVTQTPAQASANAAGDLSLSDPNAFVGVF